jgi:hypothetical protein
MASLIGQGEGVSPGAPAGHRGCTCGRAETQEEDARQRTQETGCMTSDSENFDEWDYSPHAQSLGISPREEFIPWEQVKAENSHIRDECGPDCELCQLDREAKLLATETSPKSSALPGVLTSPQSRRMPVWIDSRMLEAKARDGGLSAFGFWLTYYRLAARIKRLVKR